MVSLAGSLIEGAERRCRATLEWMSPKYKQNALIIKATPWFLMIVGLELTMLRHLNHHPASCSIVNSSLKASRKIVMLFGKSFHKLRIA